MAGGELRRQAILEAMIRVAGDKGYQATSVADVLVEAGASRTTFYKHFDDKHDCFLAAYELVVERVLAAAVAGCAEREDWPAAALDGLAAVVELFVREPELARTAVVEAAVAGVRARRRQGAAIDSLARLLDEGWGPRRRPQLPASTALMAVSGVVGLMFDRLQAGRADELPQLLPELEFALLVPFVGPRAAIGEISPSPERSESL